MKVKGFFALLLSLAVFLSLPLSAVSPRLDGMVSSSAEEVYPGVNATEYFLDGGESYGDAKQFLRVIEFDPKNEELALDVVMAGEHVGDKAALTDIIDDFNENNGEGKKVVCAVNGDLWMTASHHSRVEGESSDPVVKRELCCPRGYNVVDGEIICTQNIAQETPWDEHFLSFGITEDGEAYIGNINTYILVKNETKNSTKFKADGLNRLPADDAIVVYSDKGPTSNYCLDDAYEVVVDCDEDYTFFHGNTIKGKVVAISRAGEERYPMKENRIILTARGSSKISKISSMEVGDEISFAVTVRDMYGNTDVWETITECVGGHIPVIMNGVHATSGVADRRDPMTLIGYKADGTVVLIVNDGRQEGYSVGINRKDFADLCDDLGVVSAFLLDGGGSTTIAELEEDGYELKNRPSDYYTGASTALERPIINAVMVSCYEEKSETGDVDGDGNVNVSDLFKLKRILIGSEGEVKGADVDGSGSISIQDLFALKRILAG